jgi:hypothetical protein
MRTTVDLPDDLFRRVKAEAALRGKKLRDLVEDALRLVLRTPRPDITSPTLHDLSKEACGIVRSGIRDLASNPIHMKGFGGDPLRHR